MFTYYPLANYHNLLTALQTIFADILGDAPVPPNFLLINSYSHEGLGLYLQRLPDKFKKETPYAFISLTQHPNPMEDQSISTKFLRDLVTLYLGTENRYLGTFSPLIAEGSNWFIKPIYHRVLGSIQLTIITPSQALAYEYSRYIQAVFQINKWISFRDIPFNHNIDITDISNDIRPFILNQIISQATVRVDTISNREIITFSDRNWYMLKLDSVDVVPENVPFEGDQVFWRIDFNYSIMFNEVVHYQLNYKYSFALTLQPYERYNNYIENTNIGNSTLIYQGGDEYVTIFTIEDDTTFKATTPIMIDTTPFNQYLDFPMRVRIKFDKKLIRRFTVPPGYTPSDLNDLFYNTLLYMQTNDPAYQPYYVAFTSVNGLPYYIAIYEYRDILCLHCYQITNVTQDPDFIYIDVYLTAPGWFLFAKKIN